MKSLQFTINQNLYIIDLYKDGYAWLMQEPNNVFFTECEGFFESQFEAQADALKHAHKQRIDAELDAEEAVNDAKYGGYEDQVYSEWKGSRI